MQDGGNIGVVVSPVMQDGSECRMGSEPGYDDRVVMAVLQDV